MAMSTDSSAQNLALNEAMTLRARGDLNGAERALRSALDKDGGSPALAAELGDVLRQARKWAAAAEICRTLIKADPGDQRAREHLVYALGMSGRPADAVEVALASPLRGAERARSLAASADAFYEVRRLGIAGVLYREGYAADADNFDAKIGLSQVLRNQVPRWHFGMLNDQPRNAAYEAAIGAAVTDGDVVLEIGTGAGLLAMMAVRAGAEHVYTCESVGTIAQKARDIVEANGLASKITVIPKWSTDLLVGQDLPGQADVLICEIADNLLIGEGMLAAVSHARANLLAPNARLVPTSGSVHVAPIEAPNLHALDRVGDVAGFDLSLFNEFSRSGNLSVESVRDGDFELLGEATTVFEFDFSGGAFERETKHIETTCRRGGVLHGFMVWFEMLLMDGVSIGNYPGRSGDHWGHAFFFVDAPRPVAAGETISAIVRHDTTTIDLVSE